jgi:glycosyltransferase involved in cell wall biosynthesis
MDASSRVLNRQGLRVLMVATEGPPHRGGIARVVQYLAEGLGRRGHRVDVLAYPEVSRLCLGEVRLSGMIFRSPALLRQLQSYDVLHVHGVTPTVSDTVLFVARMKRPQPAVVYTHHVELDFGPLAFPNTIYNRIHRYLSAAADETVCSSLGSASVFDGGRPTSVIPFGIDPGWFTDESTKAERFTVLYVGQFRPWKSVPILMEAVSRVHGAHLIVAGGGPEEARYRALAKRLGIDTEFQVGVDDDVLRRLYQRSHVVVVPSTSRLEAFGLALLEGMASGCVPVASNLPGVREVVGRTGFTYQAGNVHELVAILRRLRDEPQLVEQIGNRARVRARDYQRERSVAEYERLFLDLISARALHRDLGRGLEPAEVLQNHIQGLAQRAVACRVDLRLRTCSGKVERLASAASEGVQDLGPDRMFNNLVNHTVATGESVLVRPGRIPPVLPEEVLDGWTGGGMVAPLERSGQRFGALVAARQEPFDDMELASWTRSARQTASVLYSRVENAPGP